MDEQQKIFSTSVSLIGCSSRLDVFQPLPNAKLQNVVGKLMTTHTGYTKVIEILDKAEQLASKFHGGHSGHFKSAEEFHQTLIDSIGKLKQGDNAQLEKILTWFLPTSCWDDCIGREGQDLANDISAVLSILKKNNET